MKVRVIIEVDVPRVRNVNGAKADQIMAVLSDECDALSDHIRSIGFDRVETWVDEAWVWAQENAKKTDK